jgi:ribonuclease E
VASGFPNTDSASPKPAAAPSTPASPVAAEQTGPATATEVVSTPLPMPKQGDLLGMPPRHVTVTDKAIEDTEEPAPVPHDKSDAQG